MIRINPDAAMAVGLGTLGLMNALGKKPPEFLVIMSLLGTVYGLTYNITRLVEQDNTVNNMAGLGCASCPSQMGCAGNTSCPCKK